MNGEPQRIPAVNDKRGELTIFYVAHGDGVPNGYAENNRTKEVVRWKARGQHLSKEARAELAADAEQKRHARKQAERELYEATAKRLTEDLSGLSSEQRAKGFTDFNDLGTENPELVAEQLKDASRTSVLHRVDELTWKVEGRKVGPLKLAEYVEAVHESGGKVLIHQGEHVSVKRAHVAKENCLENMEKAVTAETPRLARISADLTGHCLAGYIVELGLSYDESSFCVVQLDDRLVKSSELIGHVAEGFRSSIHSRYDEDVEQWPASHNSVEQRAERERFCDLFSAHLADLVEKTQRSSVGHGLQAEERKQGVELAM